MSQPNDIRIAILGLGHVGLPTALGLADLGWSVVGADDDVAKVRRIAEGEVPFYEPGVEALLKQHIDSGRFSVETNVASAIREATVLFVCVGTPQLPDGRPDLSSLEQVSGAIAANLNGYKLIVEKSTTPVRTAQMVKQSITQQVGPSHLGSQADSRFDMAVNPEFLREGTALRDFFNPHRVVLGVETDRASRLLLEIYAPLLERLKTTVDASVIITDLNTAEIIKHASNAFLSTKVSFANMVSDLCEATGANVQDVSRGIGMDPRIGPDFLNAGIGYGGYCLPKDIRAFTWIAGQHKADFSLLEEVDRINQARTGRFVSKVRQALGDLSSRTLAIWGLSFKPGTDDVREAPSLAIVRRFREEGARLRLHDPRAMEEFRRHYPQEPPGLVYCVSPEEAAEGSDAVLLLTEWREFLDVDLANVRDAMNLPLIVDGRNLMDPAAVRAIGFEYHSIGRS